MIAHSRSPLKVLEGDPAIVLSLTNSIHQSRHIILIEPRTILVYTIRQFQIIDNKSLTTEYTVKQVNCEAGTSNPYEAGNSSTIKKIQR